MHPQEKHNTRRILLVDDDIDLLMLLERKLQRNMMGGWFLSTSIGNKLSGVLVTMWDNYNNKANYFLLNFILLLFAAIMCFAMLKWLNRIMKEKGVK